MEDVYVRRDVRTLGPGATESPWDDRLLAYARAVGVMQRRAPEDPIGWVAQATLHLGRPRGTWFLLPWVRMQLWYFERIVRAIVAEGGGPRDWALPVWGYAGAPGRARLPPAFAVAELPDGSPNPLYRPDTDRAAYLNAGAPLPPAVTSAARALAAPEFARGLGGLPGGPGRGLDPPTPGLLEAQPHDSVTAALGPDAALDPVFPLHLATVDRLWETWLAAGGRHRNPAQFDWTDQWFSFCDADRRARSLTCGQVGDLGNLDFAYAGVPAHARADHVVTAGADASPIPCAGRARRIATATPGSVELGPQPRRVTLRPAGGDEPADASRSCAVPGPGPACGRVYLHLQDAEAEPGRAGNVWEVRVEGGRAVAEASGAAAVGTIAFSGRGDDAQRFVFDITDAVEDLEAGWDDRALAVTFHPALPCGTSAAPPRAARVGSVFVTHS